MTTPEIISEVVFRSLCMQCGSCAGICSSQALKMEETEAGLVWPSWREEHCTECGLCDKVCPVLNPPAHLAAHPADPYIGPMRGAYLAEATDIKLAAEAQTGGLVRALLAWALKTDRVDGVVAVVDNPKRPLRPKAVVTSDLQRVLTVARSKYCPVPVNELIHELRGFDGRLAYVGLPCHMQGLELATEQSPKLRRKIVLRIGLFCSRVLTYHATAFHVRSARGGKSDEIAEFDYRHRGKSGWPGDIRVVTQHGEVRSAHRSCRMHSRFFFTPLSCRLCPDKLNVLADIAVGDPHGIVHGEQVPTASIVRTDLGEEVLSAALSDGWIKLIPLDARKVADGQNIRGHLAGVRAIGNEMLHRNRSLPRALRDGTLDIRKASRRPVGGRITVAWSLFAQTPRGIWLARHLPTWLPRLIDLWGRTRRVRRVLRRLLTTGRLRPKREQPATSPHTDTSRPF